MTIQSEVLSIVIIYDHNDFFILYYWYLSLFAKWKCQYKLIMVLSVHLSQLPIYVLQNLFIYFILVKRVGRLLF